MTKDDVKMIKENAELIARNAADLLNTLEIHADYGKVDHNFDKYAKDEMRRIVSLIDKSHCTIGYALTDHMLNRL